jgi:class 3 adenylate cyclase
MLLTLDSHPGLPTMRGDFFLDDAYVIVMDWIDGPDLEMVLARRGAPGLTYTSVVDYVSQAADALDHLHRNDPPIVHGDVKPANLVVTSVGKVVLVDLGLAKVSGAVREAGSRGFTAPEVIAGEPCTPAADVYGLGATTVALLTGEPPGYEPPDFGDLDPAEAGPLRRVLGLALASDPRERPATAGELAERIRAGHRSLPSGIVTFLAVEVLDDGRWDSDPTGMEAIVDRLDGLAATVVDSHAGRVLASESANHLRAVFTSAISATRAALEIQHEARVGDGPVGAEIRVRAALHTGEAEARSGAYAGPVPVRVGRLRNHAPPGHTVVSAATAELVRPHLPEGVDLVELERDGTGAMVFVLVEAGTPSIDVPRMVDPGETLPPSPAATRDDRTEQHRRLESALRNALELAEHSRRSGDDVAAARMDATAQELAEQLVALERELRG